MWHYSLVKTIALQALCSPHRLVWVLVMVLQSCSFIISAQGPWKNTKKGGHLDTWSIQDLSNRRDRGNHGSFTHQTTSTKTCGQITALCNILSLQIILFKLLWILHLVLYIINILPF